MSHQTGKPTCPATVGSVLVLRRCLAASLSDTQLVLPRSLIITMIDGTVAKGEPRCAAVNEDEP